MEGHFKRSLVVLGQLAEKTARTPPLEDNPPLEYIDRSLAILGRASDIHGNQIQNEFLTQRQFIASQFRTAEKELDRRFEESDARVNKRFEDLEARVDKRFEAVDKRIDELETNMENRFEELETKMDERFEELETRMNNRFEAVEGRLTNLEIRFDNFEARANNGVLRRLHQPINLIKVKKPTDDKDRFEWVSHPYVPKHMKNCYFLGQRAKGIFEPDWEDRSDRQKAMAMHEAQNRITELARFYEVVVYSDQASDSDATEVAIDHTTVDEYMELLLDKWGMDWEKVVRLGDQRLQPPAQIAGAKRIGYDRGGMAEKRAR